MKLWQIVALVLGGVAYGVVDPGRLTFAFGTATLYVFLPALLFEAAWNLNYRAVIRNWKPIAVLTLPGVLVSALLVAAALTVVRVPFGPALLTGAILSATDPIAVVAIFRNVPVARTLATIVECEALFNDAVAVVLYRGVLVAMAATLTATSAVSIVAQSIAASAGGIAIGVLIAYVAARSLRNARDELAQIAATLVSAYGSYFLAERLHASGIFATIACGMMLRFFERRWIALTIAQNVGGFWDAIALVANALVFFLVGASLHVIQALRAPWFVAATLAGVALSRVAVAALLLPARFPQGWLGVVRVAGLRGALCVALALALPAETPYRDSIVGAVFITALATIIASSVTVPSAVERVRQFARAKPNPT